LQCFLVVSCQFLARYNNYDHYRSIIQVKYYKKIVSFLIHKAGHLLDMGRPFRDLVAALAFFSSIVAIEEKRVSIQDKNIELIKRDPPTYPTLLPTDWSYVGCYQEIGPPTSVLGANLVSLVFPDLAPPQLVIPLNDARLCINFCVRVRYRYTALVGYLCSECFP
jgi:hypothetical protein